MKEILLATIPATIPTLAVLVGILLSQNGINKLDARMNSLEVRLGAVETRLGARIDALTKQLHDDIVMLIGRDTDKSERLARLEEKSKG